MRRYSLSIWHDCDANEAADMLERGEIDLLPTLRKTDERAERFDFPASRSPM